MIWDPGSSGQGSKALREMLGVYGIFFEEPPKGEKKLACEDVEIIHGLKYNNI